MTASTSCVEPEHGSASGTQIPGAHYFAVELEAIMDE